MLFACMLCFSMKKRLNFIPLCEWRWYHNASLNVHQRFICPFCTCACIFPRIDSALQACPTWFTQWHHVHCQSGIKFSCTKVIIFEFCMHSYLLLFTFHCITKLWVSSCEVLLPVAIILWKTWTSSLSLLSDACMYNFWTCVFEFNSKWNCVLILGGCHFLWKEVPNILGVKIFSHEKQGVIKLITVEIWGHKFIVNVRREYVMSCQFSLISG